MAACNIMFIAALLLGLLVYSEQQAIPIEDRLNALEKQVLIVALKNIHGNERIERLEKLVKQGNPIGLELEDMEPASDVEKHFLELKQSTDIFMKHINEKVLAMARGMAEEKVMMRSQIHSQEGVIQSLKEKVNLLVNQNGDDTSKSKDQNPRLLNMIQQLNQTILDIDSKSGKQQTCSEGWIRIKSTCFLYVTSGVDWYSALLKCHELEGRLVEPKDPMTARALRLAVDGSIWVGATDENVEGTWIWSGTNDKLASISWDLGQPNSFGGNQDCLEMTQTGLYNDESCMAINQYVCERPVGGW